MIRLFIFLFLFPALFFHSTIVLGTDKLKIDSLKSAYNKAEQDTTKAQVLEKIGNSYAINANYLKAIESYLEAKKIFIKLADKDNEGEMLNLIGAQYYYLKNWDKSIEYFLEAFKIVKELGDVEKQARYLNNIGLIYDRRGDYEKALEYQTRSLIINQEYKDSLGVSGNFNNIANIYSNTEEHKKAIEFYKKSLDLKRKLGQRNRLSLVLQNLSWAYYKSDNYVAALKYAKEGLVIAQEDNDLFNERDALTKLGDIYDALTDYKKANEYIKLGNLLQDSIDQLNNAELIADMDAKYEADKKDNEIALQQVEIAKQNTEVKLQTTQKIWFAIGLFLAIVLLFVSYWGFKQKQKANLQLKQKNAIIEEKNKNITDSITYASTIQQSFLPDIGEISKVLPENFVFFKPKDIVSGDFYWFYEKEDLVFIIAADCTGHGVPGAFVSMLCNNVLNHVIIEKDVNDPGQILTQVNNSVIHSLRKKDSNFKSNDGMDCSLCVVNKKNQKLAYAGAFNQLILISDGELNEFKADRSPIGGRTEVDYEFTSHQIKSKSGDCVYLFSDGYADQFGGPKGKKFMLKRLKEMFKEIHLFSFSDQKIHLDKTLNAWVGNNEQVDDIIVLGFKI